MKYITFNILGIMIFICAASAVPAQAAFLNTNTTNDLRSNTNLVGNAAGYDETTSLADVVATVIKAFLGILGMVFIILMIVAGFNWMTANGDDEKIKKATGMIRSAVIGLIIVVSAYAITYFVFENLPGAGGTSSPSV